MSCGISIIYKNSPLHYKTNFIGWLIADTKTSQGICSENQNLEGIHGDKTLINSFSKQLPLNELKLFLSSVITNSLGLMYNEILQQQSDFSNDTENSL